MAKTLLKQKTVLNFSQEKEGMKHLMTNKSSVSQRKVSNSCFHRSMEVQHTKIL